MLGRGTAGPHQVGKSRVEKRAGVGIELLAFLGHAVLGDLTPSWAGIIYLKDQWE